MVSSYPTSRPRNIVPYKVPQTFDRNLRRFPVNDLRPIKNPARAVKGLRGLGAIRGLARLNPWIMGGLAAYELYEYLRQPEGAPGYDMRGWDVRFQCTGGGMMYGFNHSTCTNRTATLNNWNLKAGEPSAIIKLGQGHYVVNTTFFDDLKHFSGKYWFANTTIGYSKEFFGVTDPNQIPIPQYQAQRPAVYTPPEQHLLNTIDPLSAPIGVPLGVPKPVPYRLIPRLRPNPWRSPHEQRQAGYDSPSLPGGRPGIPVRPDQLPTTYPTVEYSSNPADTPRPLPVHTLKPPGGGEKEGKVKISNGERFIHNIVSTVGEVNEFIDALYKTLPSAKKVKYNGTFYTKFAPTPQEKVRALYDNWAHVNYVEAIFNVAENQIEDRIFGEIGKANAKLSREVLTSRSRIGLQGRTSHIQRNIMKARWSRKL